MTRSYMHFAYIPEVKAAMNAKQAPSVEISESAEDIAAYIEKTIQEMIDSGEDSGEFKMKIPEDMPPEQAMEIINEVIRRLNERNGDNDQFRAE